MRVFSTAVMIYMLLGLVWWGKLLYEKNNSYYALKLENTSLTKVTQNEIIAERDRQRMMIFGEGIVMGLALLSGLWIINRSATKEIKAARQQSDFLLSVSHELKSPIAAIKLAMQTLGRTKVSDDKKLVISQNALQDADRLERMVQNILLSASINDQKLELYKVSFDIHDSLKKLKKEMHQGGERLQIEGSNENIMITGDESYVMLAIKNLIDNALKYGEKESPITVLLSKRDHQIDIWVTNMGQTIPHEVQRKIFDKFYRHRTSASTSTSGTGLGLYLTREILKAHGGHVDLDTDFQNGVRMHINLPALI